MTNQTQEIGLDLRGNISEIFGEYDGDYMTYNNVDLFNNMDPISDKNGTNYIEFRFDSVHPLSVTFIGMYDR